MTGGPTYKDVVIAVFVVLPLVYAFTWIFRAYLVVKWVREYIVGGDLEGDERGQAPADPFPEMAAVVGVVIVGWFAVTTLGWIPTVVFSLVVVLMIALLPVVRPSLRKGWP